MRPLARHVLILLLASSCAGPGDGETEGDETEVAAACDEWCVEQVACGATTLDQDTCASSCVADVGTPGPECAAALRELAACTMTNCDDEQACAEQLSARDGACGGTG